MTVVITKWSSELSGPETWMTLPLLSRICFSHLESSAALKVIQNIQQWISSNVMSKDKASQYMGDSSTPLQACWASHGHLSTSLLDPPPICRLQASFHLGSSQIPRDISEKRSVEVLIWFQKNLPSLTCLWSRFNAKSCVSTLQCQDALTGY